MNALSFALCTSLAATGQAGQAAEPAKADRPFEIAAVIKIAEEASVPAAEAGVLDSIDIKEGQFVEEGQKLAAIRDKENRLKVERAALETDIALRKFQNDLDIRFAKKSTEVAKAELARSSRRTSTARQRKNCRGGRSPRRLWGWWSKCIAGGANGSIRARPSPAWCGWIACEPRAFWHRATPAWTWSATK
jgi:multidrug efflux pump subunit AcrA (membrane-fusion protein)